MYLTCETVRLGKSCVFWKKGNYNNKTKIRANGKCAFNGGHCLNIVEQCTGCKFVEKSTAGNFCLVYMDPSASWIQKRCPMYVNPDEIKKQEEEQKMKNPLKASRRKAKGRSLV